MSTHYICTGGCGGVSSQPGFCQATECELYQQELVECDCEDGSHGRADDYHIEDEDDEM